MFQLNLTHASCSVIHERIMKKENVTLANILLGRQTPVVFYLTSFREIFSGAFSNNFWLMLRSPKMILLCT